MDPQTQAIIAALMGGQNNVQPSAVAPQPQQQQFSPQATGYGMQSPQHYIDPQTGMPSQIPGMYAQGMQPQNMTNGGMNAPMQNQMQGMGY